MATWSRRPTMPMRWFATRPAPAVPVPRSRQPDFDRLDTWNETSFADRRADVEATIDALLAHGDFRDVIDAEAIGAAGHSLGGYTVVGMAGGWAGWLDRRIRAVLGLSPYVMPFQVQERLGNVQVPLMYQGGTLDVGITPFLAGPNGAYRHANPPAFFLVLRMPAISPGSIAATPTAPHRASRRRRTSA